MSSGPFQAEISSLRQELAAVRLLLTGLEARFASLEAEAEFEAVSVHEVSGPGSGGVYLSQAVPLAGPRGPSVPGSGGVELSQARTASELRGSPAYPSTPPRLPASRSSSSAPLPG